MSDLPTPAELKEIERQTEKIEAEKEKKRREREEKKAERLKKKRRYFLEKLVAPALFILTVVVSLLLATFTR